MEINTDRHWLIRDAETSVMFHDTTHDHWEEWRVVREVDEDEDYEEVEEDDEVFAVMAPKFTWIEYESFIIEFSRIVRKAERRPILQECVDLLSRRKIVPAPYFSHECDYYNRVKDHLKRIDEQYGEEIGKDLMERTREDWKTLK